MVIPGTRATPTCLRSRQGVKPAFTEYNVDDRYTWNKCPRYDGKPLETGGFARLLVAYKRNVPFVVEHIDSMLVALGAQKGDLSALQNTLGRTGARQIETLYVATLMKEWVTSCEAVQAATAPTSVSPASTAKAPASGGSRGALYPPRRSGRQDAITSRHSVYLDLARTMALRLMEQALIGVPVADIEKPINALRTVSRPLRLRRAYRRPKTGKTLVTSPWG
ncbi:MAG: nickel-dependent hydrogenase large subunit [Eggerthellaceae bacterium]